MKIDFGKHTSFNVYIHFFGNKISIGKRPYCLYLIMYGNFFYAIIDCVVKSTPIALKRWPKRIASK